MKNINLASFQSVTSRTQGSGLWVRIHAVCSISAEAYGALGKPRHITVSYSDEHNAFLIAPTVDGEGYTVNPNRQFNSTPAYRIAREHGWKNERHPAEMTDTGLLVHMREG